MSQTAKKSENHARMSALDDRAISASEGLSGPAHENRRKRRRSHTDPCSSAGIDRPNSRQGTPAPAFVSLRSEVLAAIDAMQQNLGHPWSIAELARVAHVSGSHLMRLFTEEIGMAPIAWLTRRRVQEMARLLRETGLSILEITRQVGWRDRGHASEQFKRIAGATPTQYRARQDDASERHCLWCGQPIPAGDTAAEIGDRRNLGGDVTM